MSWASNYIAKLQAGETVQFRPRGNSMTGLINSGQLVTVRPVTVVDILQVGDVVLCRVGGADYLHKITATDWGRFQISNNRGHINGWTNRDRIFGVVTAVGN